jgi:hypothetical protein
VKADETPQLLNAFEEGDKVKLPVEENGKYFAKRMEIVKAERKRGMWEYQVKGVGEASLHKDQNGNDWFRENDLEWWE